MQSEFTACRNNKTFKRNQTKDANFSSTFLGKFGEIRQLTNISRTKIEKIAGKFDINVRIKGKKGSTNRVIR